MARLPFDPQRAKGPDGPGKPARRERKRFAGVTEAGALTVTQAAELIKTTLEDRLPASLRVVGEVSNLNTPGHWYFSLKDSGAVLSCVAWATSVKQFGFTPRDGDEVVATGHISHFAPQGRTQLYVSALKPVGAGALEQKFRAMCAELRGLGYFDEARKKPLPLLPRLIAVITSASGAALQDVLATAAQRCPAIGLLIVDVRVQGEGAAAQVARAIRWVDAHCVRLGVEAMLVTRGGGSMEDLWAFNERVVADAVFTCSLPVVAAIGHESDTTVIELVADVRAATPTQAIVRLVPARDELLAEIDHRHHRLVFVIRRAMQASDHQVRVMAHTLRRWNPAGHVSEAGRNARRQMINLRRIVMGRLAQGRAAIEGLMNRLTRLLPRTLAVRKREQLAVAMDRLRHALRRRVDQRENLALIAKRFIDSARRHVSARRERLEDLDRHLGAVGPLRVLSRGYSLTTDSSGRLIASVTAVRLGQTIVTRLKDGSIPSVVSTNEGGAARSTRRRLGPDQMDLFAPTQ